MTTLVLDIETVPDATVWAPPADEPDRCPPPYAHRIVVIGRLLLDEALRPVKLTALAADADDERAALQGLHAAIAHHQPRIVSWNGRAFDVPCILARSMGHGIAAAWLSRVQYRFADKEHADVMDLVSCFGASRGGIPLGAMARLCGLPGKHDVDGSKVKLLYEAGESERIAAYCATDVVQTAFVWLRWELLKGNGFTRERYTAAARALLDCAAADPRLAQLAAAIDRRRLLLDDVST